MRRVMPLAGCNICASTVEKPNVFARNNVGPCRRHVRAECFAVRVLEERVWSPEGFDCLRCSIKAHGWPGPTSCRVKGPVEIRVSWSGGTPEAVGVRASQVPQSVWLAQLSTEVYESYDWPKTAAPGLPCAAGSVSRSATAAV
uniref:Uncharacterized protein n=1 Tax=Sipha flava TaxID=143950 RepID=A0A2S2Q360_9HEMI